MHKIYFEKRCLAVCSPQEQALSDPNAVRWQGGGAGEGIPELVRYFRGAAHLPRVLVPTEDQDAVYRAVCAQFREVNAAGGLVSNRRGDVLLIRRDSLWDLPKGHQEAGEDIETTALREVQEETGVDRLMLYTDPVDLTPQREENISLAAWVARSSLAPYLKNTYPSIVEVFREAKI